MHDHPDNLTLDYNGQPIRIAMLEGVPWFSVSDVCAAIGSGPMSASVRSKFPAHAIRPCNEPNGAGAMHDNGLLSPVGVWLLGHLQNPKGSQKLAAWAKREACLLCPEPQAGDPTMSLSFAYKGDGSPEMPPHPWKFSGRRAEWYALQDTMPAALDAHHNERRIAQARQQLAALNEAGTAREFTPRETSLRQRCEHILGLPPSA